MKIGITMFGRKRSHLFPSSKITVNCQRQKSLPTHIHGIGQPIYGNWDMKALVQSMPFFQRNPNS